MLAESSEDDVSSSRLVLLEALLVALTLLCALLDLVALLALDLDLVLDVVLAVVLLVLLRDLEVELRLCVLVLPAGVLLPLVHLPSRLREPSLPLTSSTAVCALEPDATGESCLALLLKSPIV